MQRRVYDALNVFSALNIVHKNKNKISLRPSITNEEDKEAPTKNSGISSKKILENTTKIWEELSTLRVIKLIQYFWQ